MGSSGTSGLVSMARHQWCESYSVLPGQAWPSGNYSSSSFLYFSHLHIHIISSDLCSPTLKTKKHLNSFHPKHGFFLPFTEVLSWFDAEDSYFTTMAALKKSQYEPILKEDLTCWRCEGTFKNMPALKTHLQEEFDKLTSREKAKAERKRKLEQKSDLDSAAGEIHKKSKTSVSEDGAS
ncbi:hypothetical protein HGRIS_013118 [Hohenbuehelia grisea]|uniref:Aprataxin C2HE/C2H2/C2HC zinc finger domain-containing protein n=1 Tax=Hohenbuehelia grisea TaxID=104357 RepID=A0ABR3IUS2_9AGAR